MVALRPAGKAEAQAMGAAHLPSEAAFVALFSDSLLRSPPPVLLRRGGSCRGLTHSFCQVANISMSSIKHARTFPLANPRPRHRPARLATVIDPSTTSNKQSPSNDELLSPRLRRTHRRATSEDEHIIDSTFLTGQEREDDQPLLEENGTIELRRMHDAFHAQNLEHIRDTVCVIAT